MGAGIGWLQRDILATLEEAKQACLKYRGSPYWENIGEIRPYDKPGWVLCKKNVVRLSDGVYDLRACSHYLAQKHDGMDRQWISVPFQVSFSRAARGLVKRGLLNVLSVIPVIEVDEDHCEEVHHLADGMYLIVTSRQVRFVKCYV